MRSIVASMSGNVISKLGNLNNGFSKDINNKSAIEQQVKI